MFGETRLVTLFSTNDTPLQIFQNNSHSAPKIELSVNYFGVKCQLFWKFWNGVSFIKNKM